MSLGRPIAGPTMVGSTFDGRRAAARRRTSFFRCLRLAVAILLVAYAGAGSARASTGRLVYHGGPVLTHTSTTYIIYWQGPQGRLPLNYVPDLAQFVSDWSGSSAHRVLTQYFQRVNGTEHVSNSIEFGGVITAKDAFPREVLTDGELKYEIRRVVNTHHLPDGYRANYALVLPQGQGADDGYGDCAWHDWLPDPQTSGKIFYAVIPYYSHSIGCPTPVGPYPHAEDIDNAIDRLSHELSEVATNPWHIHRPLSSTAWFANTRGHPEIGDLCARIYGPRDPTTGADVLLHGHPYLIQGEWSNSAGDCSLGLPPRGGAGAVYPDGRVGRLRVRLSTMADVISFAGVPEAQWYDPSYGVYGLGYDGCAAGGRSVSLAGMRCHTDFFINAQTDRFIVFGTDSRRYSALGRIPIGASTRRAEQITHTQAYSGCGDNIFLSHGQRGTTGYTTMDLFIDGGHEGPGLTIHGGHVGTIGLDAGGPQVIDCV